MRLSVLKLMLLLSFVTTYGRVNSQKIISKLKLEDVELSVALEKLEELSSYDFVFNYNDSKGYQVSVDMDSNTLEECLNEVLKGLPFQYSIGEDLVIISYKKIEPAKQSQQQNKQFVIKGTVTDEMGIPLPGVSIVVKGTTIGTTTDLDGKYAFRVPEGSQMLVFSFIGMKTIEHKLDSKVINVSMQLDQSELGEVVVTGYQTVERYKSTSSVTTVDLSGVESAGALSVDNMLQGKAPGLMAMNVSATPGAAPKIRIRGTSTITGSREPVWVVDGIMWEQPVNISNDEINSLDNINLIGNAISGLNPEDIERIDILKDASATAIYGTKAANGVIVVTTKKGKQGKTTVNYNNNFQFSARPAYNDFELMNSKERIALSKEIQARNLTFNKNVDYGIGYEGALFDYYNKKLTFDEFNARVKSLETMNTDWFDILFQNAWSQSHNLSISGGNDKTTYYFSVGYNNTEGTEKGVNVEQMTSQMRITTKLFDKLSLDFKLAGSMAEKDYNHSSLNLFGYAYNTSRAIPVRDANGDYAYYTKTYSGQQGQYPIRYNILNEMDRTSRNIESKNLNLTLNLNYDIWDGLKYNSVIGLNTTNTLETEIAEEESYFAAAMRGYELNDPNVIEDDIDRSKLPRGGVYTNGNTNNYSYSFRNQLIYNKNFDAVHDVNVILGNEMKSIQYKGNNYTALGYMPDRGHSFIYIDPSDHPSDQYKYWLEGHSGPRITHSISRYLSYFGAFTYTYNRKYSLNANARIDGSNHFGVESNSKLLPVWSVSGKWNIHEENFLKEVKNIDVLSLRLSYGFQGNSVEYITPEMLFRKGDLSSKTGYFNAYVDKWPNDNLTWEKTKSYNIGLDFGVLKNRLSGTLEYYHKQGEDLLYNQLVSLVNGEKYLQLNGTDILNRGFEAGLTAGVLRTKDFNWELSANFSYNTNEVTKSKAADSGSYYSKFLNGSLIREGKSVDGFYSYEFLGLDATGTPIFKGINDVPEDEKNFDGLDVEQFYNSVLTYSGSRVPKYTGGFTNTFSYKNLRVSATFSYSLGGHRRKYSLYQSRYLPDPEQNLSAEFVNRWQNSGDEAYTNIPGLSNGKINISSSFRDEIYVPFNLDKDFAAMYNNSTARLLSTDYLRFQNLNIAYTMPGSFIKKCGLSKAVVSFTAQNLFVIADKDLGGIDPENISTASMPITPSYNLGLNVTF